jgi:hypothetical protein
MGILQVGSFAEPDGLLLKVSKINMLKKQWDKIIILLNKPMRRIKIIRFKLQKMLKK